MARELESAVIAVGGPGDEAAVALFKRLVDKGLATPSQEGDADGGVVVGSEGTVYSFKYQDRSYKFVGSELAATATEKDREAFWEVFEPFARSRAVPRAITWLLVSLSGVFLAVAVLQNVWSVLPRAVHSTIGAVARLTGFFW